MTQRTGLYSGAVPALGYVAAALGGMLLGWLLAAMLRSRFDDQQPSDGAARRGDLATVVVENSASGYLMTDEVGNVLLANSQAATLGVVRAGMPVGAVQDAIERAAASGEPVDVDLEELNHPAVVGLRPEAQVHADVRAVGDHLVLVSAADDSVARRVEAVRRDFVANVSHELKTPVGAMSLLAEAVLDASDDPELVCEFASRMVAESRRLSTLVAELLSLSRLQSADPMDMSVVDIDVVVTEVLSRQHEAARQAGIELSADGPCAERVRGDRTMLVTALGNLVQNAINYSPAASPVTISRSVMDGFVDISVTDRGVGIAPEYQQRVFERFFRVDQARSRATGGTGLGLAIVKHVAANHGGAALLWSRPGLGSTFTLHLPCLTGPANAGPVERKSFGDNRSDR